MSKSLVSLITNLQRRNSRRRHPAAVLESVRLCEEALDAGIEFVGVVRSPALERTSRGVSLRTRLETDGIRLEEVDDLSIRALADTDTPQGVLAVVLPRKWTFDDISMDAAARILVLDGVQDPGNVGTICRTAFGLGATGVVALPGTARLNNPKVLRGGMGATFRLPVVAADVPGFVAWVHATSVSLWAAVPDGSDIRDMEPPERVAIVIGNEGAGVSEVVLELAERSVAVPMVRRADSLNAATAAAVLLYEVLR